MPRQSPSPEAVDREFYIAANDERLTVQHCQRCDRWQFPPEVSCRNCTQSDALRWRDVDGRGTIYSYCVIHDTPVASMKSDVPYNAAVISLDACPGVVMVTVLPGSAPGDVRIGQAVRLTFVATEATGQKVPEWELIG